MLGGSAGCGLFSKCSTVTATRGGPQLTGSRGSLSINYSVIEENISNQYLSLQPSDPPADIIPHTNPVICQTANKKQGLYPPMISSYNKMQGGNNSFQNPLISKDSDCHEILFYAR